MMEDEIIPVQLNLLQVYRRNLQHLLVQAAHHGGEQSAPLPIFNGIHEARSQIRHIKITLRAYGMVVEDHPDDEATSQRIEEKLHLNTKLQKARIRTKRQLLYELHLSNDAQQLWRALYTFVFLPPDQQIVILENTIKIGALDQATFNRIVIPALDNCSVECDIRIIDDGNDSRQWAGIRVRGLQENLMLGYLVYLRSQGTVELYRAGEVVGGANKIVVPDSKTNWTHLRIDTFEQNIQVHVNRRSHLKISDKSFGEKGYVYLHTHKATAQYKNLRVYELHR